jgi:hypothetical protein
MSRAWSTPSGRESWSTTGIFFKPRSFIRVQTSCSKSPGRQNTTSRVIANEAAVMQPAPWHWLIWLTMSVLVMTPAKRPAEPHTTTRPVPVRRSFAASTSGASSAIVTSFSRAVGNNLSTNVALSPGSLHHPTGCPRSRFRPPRPHRRRALALLHASVRVDPPSQPLKAMRKVATIPADASAKQPRRTAITTANLASEWT